MALETRVLDGKSIAEKVLKEVKDQVDALKSQGRRAPGLCTVLVGDHSASALYVKNKRKRANEVGIASFHHELPQNTSEKELLALISELNSDNTIDGILVQLPLPRTMSEHRIISAIDPKKDVDGFHPENLGRLYAGRPALSACTPLACMRLLHEAGVKLKGANAVVIGRSNIVGKPMAALLLNADATVTICHRYSKDLKDFTRLADVIVIAAGKQNLVTADHIKEGAVLIDVGINRREDGSICGDLSPDVKGKASIITPVPGGVGPMTIAMLMQNTLTTYELEKHMKHTPLYEAHVTLGAQMVEFAGYAMPVRYSSEKVEHMAVRKQAGLFDVSHMGEIFLRGPRACEAADTLVTNDIKEAKAGQAVYGAMLNEHAGIVDDIVAYKFSSEKVLLCVNASNKEKDVAWVHKVVDERFSRAEVQAEDVSDSYAQIALQGPRAADVLKQIVAHDTVDSMKRYHFCEVKLSLGDAIVARTGYTGEDGFEIFIAPERAEALWNHLLDVGVPFGLIACGLSARDTLRLEAGMCLYGNDINDDTTPLEAGIGFAVKWNKHTPFLAQDVLLRQKERGIDQKLVGLTLSDRNIARHGYEVCDEASNKIGEVTSGTLAPFLNLPIAMAYVKKPFAEPGTTVYVKVRQNLAAARVTKLPFYKANKNVG